MRGAGVDLPKLPLGPSVHPRATPTSRPHSASRRRHRFEQHASGACRQVALYAATAARSRGRGRCTINSAAWKKASRRRTCGGLHVLPADRAAGTRLHTDVRECAVNEDRRPDRPAAAIAGYIATFDKPGDGSHLLVIEQGFEMAPEPHRAHLNIAGAKLTGASSARCGVVMDGTIEA